MKSIVGFSKLFADMADRAQGKKRIKCLKKSKQPNLGNTQAGRQAAQGPPAGTNRARL